MNFQLRYSSPDNEKPLENYAPDGGFASIFRTVAFVGDSLSSGEFETFNPETGVRRYYDMFEYSWYFNASIDQPGKFSLPSSAIPDNASISGQFLYQSVLNATNAPSGIGPYFSSYALISSTVTA